MKQNPPNLLGFLAKNALLGVLIGQVFLIGLLASDAMGLATVLIASSNPALPLAMLSAVFAITFGAAVTATAVLSLPCLPDANRR